VTVHAGGGYDELAREFDRQLADIVVQPDSAPTTVLRQIERIERHAKRTVAKRLVAEAREGAEPTGATED
jgi:hypothetical protein